MNSTVIYNRKPTVGGLYPEGTVADLSCPPGYILIPEEMNSTTCRRGAAGNMHWDNYPTCQCIGYFYAYWLEGRKIWTFFLFSADSLFPWSLRARWNLQCDGCKQLHLYLWRRIWWNGLWNCWRQFDFYFAGFFPVRDQAEPTPNFQNRHQIFRIWCRFLHCNWVIAHHRYARPHSPPAKMDSDKFGNSASDQTCWLIKSWSVIWYHHHYSSYDTSVLVLLIEW